jgi:hypothetical protein
MINAIPALLIMNVIHVYTVYPIQEKEMLTVIAMMVILT